MLTVALPLWKADKIGWLALESLCRQEDVPCDWELIIAEEQIGSFIGESRIEGYKERLKAVGCTRIEYIKLKEWITLSRKWYLIGQHMSEGSIGYLLQPADGYSSKTRLAQTYHLMTDKEADWVQLMEGYAYEIKNGIWRWFNARKRRHPCSSSMAVRSSLVRNMADTGHRKSGVDYWIYKRTNPKKKLYLDWEKSADAFTTGGYNTISKERSRYLLKCRGMFEKTDYRGELVPKEVMDKLRELKKG